MARIFCKRNVSNCSFLAAIVVQRFCTSYMESPPPAVFLNKYQSCKYEEINIFIIRCKKITYPNVFDDQRQHCDGNADLNFCLGKDMNMFCSDVIIILTIIFTIIITFIIITIIITLIIIITATGITFILI